MTLESPLGDIKGVGVQLEKKLATLGLKTIGDLILFFPHRYEDYSVITPIAKIKPGPVTIQAVIKQVGDRYVRRGMHITEAVASDKSGSVRIIWFNQPYRKSSLKSNTEYFISGLLELRRQHFSIMNPSIELISEFPVNTARLVPIYRETKGLTSKQIRRAMRQVLPLIRGLPETLPGWLIANRQLMSRAQAVENLHFAQNSKALERAKYRVGFEEVFELSLASLLNRQENLSESSLAIQFNEGLAKNFVTSLPFTLTNSQRKVIWQIYLDMQKTHPMNRLVEGDVGSGKTVVATMAALMVMEQGYQVALMAPTELLARQHADTIHNLLQPLGLSDKVGLLVGSMTQRQKSAIRSALISGRTQFIVGTQALLQDKVDMRRLGLITIDEQHRFGVEQRKSLMTKAGHMPHVLSLTATPIPRSLALTLYGELDISALKEKPKGRKSITTQIISPNSRTQFHKTIDRELAAGHQMFVVCPLIRESEVLQLNSAEKLYAELSKKDFKHRRIGLLHGKMKSTEKISVMEQFIAHKLDVLVSTTVIEVGVDVPNATIMYIEAADRFGLAQIHQLRGRVGRSEFQGFCYLVLSTSAAPSRRIRALEQNNDGFKLAELDLELRGPGAIYGTLQHGELDLRVAKLSDLQLISQARQSAKEFVERRENLLHYKQLLTHVMHLKAVTNLN